MKAFNFPLESLRTLRQQRERTAQQRYARALVQCDEAERGWQRSEAELQTAHALFRSELAAGVAAGRLVQLRTWGTVLEIRRNQAAAAVTEARRNVEDASRLMTAAAREREALDRFHDKSQHLWQRAFHADEQKVYDELAVQRQAEANMEKSLLN